MRTSKKEVTSIFDLWLVAVKGRKAKTYGDVGGYCLNYNSVYGGYNIERIVNKHGGVTVVLDQRMTIEPFVYALRMSMRTIEEMRRNHLLEHISHCPAMGDGCAHFTNEGDIK